MLALYSRFAEVTGEGDGDTLAELTQKVWRAVAGENVDLAGLDQVAETLIPPEDHPLQPDAWYAENAVICVAYALSAWVGDVQHAVFAARHVYDAADFAAQQFEPGSEFTPDLEVRLRGSTFVVEAVRGIDADLAVVEAGDPDWDRLRDRARSEGRDWTRGFPYAREGAI